MQTFTEWLKQNGASFDQLEVKLVATTTTSDSKGEEGNTFDSHTDTNSDNYGVFARDVIRVLMIQQLRKNNNY